MIKVILFDLGNVLVDFDYNIAAKRIAHFSGANLRDIPKLLLGSSITGLFEEGRIPPEEFFLRVKELLKLRISYERFVPIWNEVFFLSGKNRSVYSLANRLKDDYRIAMLSNINILHYEYLKERFPVFSIFHEVFVSCGMGLVKPNPQIYMKALDILGVEPEEAFYTDDREELVKSARRLKINGFVFKDIIKLKGDLAASGVGM
ncbi:MAG: HAD family phosphatase [Candidatus Omnitrophota bacterium]